MIKESGNIIGQEAHLTTSNQKWQFQVLPSLDYLRVKNLRDRLIPSRDTDDKEKRTLPPKAGFKIPDRVVIL